MVENPQEGVMPDEIALAAMLIDRMSKKLEVYGDTDDEFVVRLRQIKELSGLQDGAEVIYPGSSTHVGVARVFGKEHVTHVDPDEKAMVAMSDAGYLTETCTIEDYRPEQPADAIIALNSYGKPTQELIGALVRPGGIVVANNHTHWAAALNEQEGLTLMGAIFPNYYGPDAKLLSPGEVPEGACEIAKAFYIIGKGGRVTMGSPDHYTFMDDEPRYPDALFIFQRQQA